MRKGKDPDPHLWGSDQWIRIRILEAQKHADPDPQHCLFPGVGEHEEGSGAGAHPGPESDAGTQQHHQLSRYFHHR